MFALAFAAFIVLFASASALALNVTGIWNANYHCEVGWCEGEDFPAPGVKLEQEKGSTHVNAPPSASGTLNGNVLTLDGEEGSYKFHEVLTIASDGKSWSGLLSDSHETSGTDTATRVSGPAESTTVSGIVQDPYEKGIGGVLVKLSGTTDEHEEVSKTEPTNGEGRYSFEVPAGNYTVTLSGEPPEQNGGTYEVTKVKQSGTVSAGEVPPAPATPAPSPCTGTAKDATCTLQHIEAGEEGRANFTYTYCTAEGRTANGKPVTSCPIIFIPGFLGSRIVCNTGELWPNLPTGLSSAYKKAAFNEMLLEEDGVTNGGAPGSCNKDAHALTGQEGVVGLAAGEDIYQSVLDYLNRIVAHGTITTEAGAYAYPYDWRRSPLLAAEGLDAYVDQVLGKSGAKHVTLMAHSMGGLVLQAYLVDPAHAKKVARAITLGTPYWGAPKSHTALLTAKSNTPKPELIGLDLFIHSAYLQEAARNMQGLYWLYPDGNFGPWLKLNIAGRNVGKSGLILGSWLSSSQMGPWVSALGGTPSLEAHAYAGHASLDGFKTNEVPYQVVVGVGLATITRMEVTETGLEQLVNVTYGSGDGTVPAVSATQGVSEGKAPLAADVPIDYECEIDHVALPGSAAVQKKIEGFLLKGDPVTSGTKCPYSGVETELFKLEGKFTGLTAAVQQDVTVLSGKESLSLEKAVQQHLLQVVPDGNRTIVITQTSHPVTLEVAPGIGAKVRSVKSAAKGSAGVSGPPSYYLPGKGSLDISSSGAATRNGRKVKATRPGRPPHTSARVTRRGKLYVVRLTVAHPHIVAGTFVRIGKAAVKRYGKPLKLKKSQLAQLTFASVDKLGHWERTERARLSHHR